MTDFELKDSGQHKQYESGMRRDTQEGKPRFALMITKAQPYEEQMLTRYANHLAKGAAKYDDRNWEDGDSEVELERAKDSLLRHTMQLLAGERDEDHAAAVWFNTQAVEYFRWRIEQKALAVQAEMKKAKKDVFVHIPNATLEINNASASDEVIAMITGRVAAPPWTDVGFTDGLSSGPKLKPGPPEDRIRAQVNVDADKHLARVAVPGRTPKTLLLRVGEWLERYGIELLEGDLGDTYERIDIVEFDMRLKHAAKIIRKSPVDSAFEIQ